MSLRLGPGSDGISRFTGSPFAETGCTGCSEGPVRQCGTVQGDAAAGEVLDPSEAARGFPEAFGVPATRIPADLPGLG